MSFEFRFRTQCEHCRNVVAGGLHFDQHMKIIDSDGGMLFNDGWKCHNCLGEPWSSADMVVQL